MGFFSNLLGRGDDDYDYDYDETEEDEDEEGVGGALPDLHNGMTLGVETLEGVELLSGRITGYAARDTGVMLERLPGGLSFKPQQIGSKVQIRGCDDKMDQFILRGTIQESTRLVCRVKDLKRKAIPEQRQNFRLQINAPASLFYLSDETQSNPEECTLVDISTGGGCLESEFLHAEDEVLLLKVKLMDYAPMEFMGEIIRVVEYQPGKFRYGFLFAQLKESELTELTRTLYNIQVGNARPHKRGGYGAWSN